jgi:hypothetical protein
VAVSRLLILIFKIANNRCKVKFNFGVFLGYCCKISKLFKGAKNHNRQIHYNTVNIMMQRAKQEARQNIKDCVFLHYRAGSLRVRIRFPLAPPRIQEVSLQS